MAGFLEDFVTAAEDGAALTNTTTATSIIPAARKIVLPPALWQSVGRRINIFAAGRISTAAATPGTLTFDVRFGSTVVWASGASGTLATSATNLTWRMWLTLTCRAIGTSATVLGTGELSSFGLSATVPTFIMPASAPAAGTAFDGTAAQTLDLFATFSVTSASNSLTLHQFHVDSPTY